MSDNAQLLDKLSNALDDVKERLIRIEENVKDVKNIKTDVEELKVKYASMDAKASSAHKRLDNVENNQTWLWRTVIGGLIAGAIGLLFFVFQMYIKG